MKRHVTGESEKKSFRSRTGPEFRKQLSQVCARVLRPIVTALKVEMWTTSASISWYQLWPTYDRNSSSFHAANKRRGSEDCAAKYANSLESLSMGKKNTIYEPRRLLVREHVHQRSSNGWYACVEHSREFPHKYECAFPAATNCIMSCRMNNCTMWPLNYSLSCSTCLQICIN